ncbi:MAG: RidA family protein [Candidatus Rokuibacteriota bacterium]
MPTVITPKEFGAPLGMYSHGMVGSGGQIVVVAGQVGMTAGRVAGPDVESQTKASLENVRTVLEAGGCSMRDVIRLQTFLTSADDIPGFMKARGEVFPRYFPDAVYPPNTLLVVSRLVRPDLCVEIEAMAVKGVRQPSGVAGRRGGTKRRPARRRPARRR